MRLRKVSKILISKNKSILSSDLESAQNFQCNNNTDILDLEIYLKITYSEDNVFFP
jgi:hypothetical protein